MTSIPSLTVLERPEPTYPYRFDDAIADARGNSSDDSGVDDDWRYSGTNNTITLWTSGCLDENGSHNCTAACQDTVTGPHMVWNSAGNMTTLHNCLVYPILSRASKDGWLVERPPGLLDKYNILSDNTSHVNISEQVPPQESDWPVINNCMHRMCELVYDDDSHDCDAWGRYRTNFTVGQEDALWSSLVTNAEFCSMGQKSLNADIGGRGVLISYIQQLCLVLVAWLIVLYTKRTWKKGLINCRNGYRICINFLRLRRSSCKLAPAITEQPPDSPELHTALITALYDFQRTQIFFSVTLQVTNLIVLGDITWLDAVTVPELKMGLLMLEIISSMGIFPLALNLITLSRDKGNPEPFIFGASIIAMLLAGGPFLRITLGDWKPGKLRQQGYNPDVCGHLNPLQHCISGDALMDFSNVLDRSTGEDIVRFAAALFLITWLIYGVFIILIDRILRICSHRFHSELHKRIRDAGVPKALPFVKFITEFILLCANCSTLSTFYKLRNQIPLAEWSLGQCLAVAIWIPFLIDFIYLWYKGVKKSVSARLARGYKVVEEDMTMSSTSLPVTTDGELSSGHSIHGQDHNASSSSYELLNGPPRASHASTWSPG